MAHVKEGLLESAEKQLGLEEFGIIDLKNAETADFGTPLVDKGSRHRVHKCLTEPSSDLPPGTHAIRVGHLGENIPRWCPNSVLKWAAWRLGYNSQEDADYAAVHLAMAAQKWNEADIGVQFKQVLLAKDANFVICHGGFKKDVFAESFFPNDNPLNMLYVYSDGFKPQNKADLWRYLMHELGHVLGLKHEFAKTSTYLVDKDNNDSVMAYNDEPPELQKSDINGTKQFYAKPEASFVGLGVIKNYIAK